MTESKKNFGPGPPVKIRYADNEWKWENIALGLAPQRIRDKPRDDALFAAIRPRKKKALSGWCREDCMDRTGQSGIGMAQ